MIAKLVVVVLLLCGIVLVAACQSTPGAAKGGSDDGGEPLLGTSWTLVSMERDGATFELPEDARPPTVSFRRTPEKNGARQLGGFGGINTYFGDYTATSDGTLSVGPLGMTRMAGPPQLMDLERDFTTTLQSATAYEIDGDALLLRGEAGLAHLKRQD